jgi:hypothetical protein
MILQLFVGVVLALEYYLDACGDVGEPNSGGTSVFIVMRSLKGWSLSLDDQ